MISRGDAGGASGQKPPGEGRQLEEDSGERRRKHYEDIIRGYALLFKPRTAEKAGAWPALIEYRLSSGVSYYYNEGKTTILHLEFPSELEGMRDQIKSHLGPNWAVWEALVRDTKSHLGAVVAEWERILEELSRRARAIGLSPYEKLFDRPLDIYWPSMFLNAVWTDIGFYETNGTHQWQTTKVVEEQTPLQRGHFQDVVQTWVFSDLPWMLTQSKEAAESMKEAWKEEALKAEPRIWDLLEERDLLQDRSRALLRGLRRAEAEVQGYGRGLANACPVCQPLIEQLNGTGPSGHR
ncbi:MAG: hypothetical protein OK474_09290 [Thaumarchaeota archaeon]|nr:hypothetical protein [Nitrososphaerota archaeon]